MLQTHGSGWHKRRQPFRLLCTLDLCKASVNLHLLSFRCNSGSGYDSRSDERPSALLIVILIVALFAIGPERLPKAARVLGRAVGSFKKYMNEATSELREVSEEFKEVSDELASVKKSVTEVLKDAEKEIEEAAKETDKAIKEAPEAEKKAEEKAEETEA